MPRRARWNRVGPALAGVLLVLVPGLVEGPAHAARSSLPSKHDWLVDVNAELHSARPKLDERVTEGQQAGQRMGINLDIDNTSIETYYSYPDAVPETLYLAQRYHARGVKLLFNTGRDADQLDAIKQALVRAGYSYSYVCGRNHGETVAHSKERCRQFFTGLGFTLIANIGNRNADFAGTRDWDYGYKLPSYDGQLM